MGEIGVKAWITLKPHPGFTMDPKKVDTSENLMSLGNAHLTVLLPGYEL